MAIEKESLHGKPLEFHFPLVENGFDFLLSSLEHLTTASSHYDGDRKEQVSQIEIQRRSMKYALLHACSSIELLFKERLRQEHWSLVFKDVNKAKLADYERGDFQSVQFEDAQIRLSQICDIQFTEEEEKQLRNFRDRRNKLEHFGMKDTLPAVISTVTAMVSLVMEFVKNSFLQEPLREAEDTLAVIRKLLGNCNAFVEHRWKEISGELHNRNAIECVACAQSAAIAEDGIVSCVFCHHSEDSESAATAYIEQVLGLDSYSVATDGGEWPLDDCPSCGNHTLVTAIPDPPNTFRSMCFDCGTHWNAESLSVCAECGTRYPSGKDDGVICSQCWQYRVERDD